MEGYIMNKKLLFPIFCLFLIVVSLLVINGCGSAASSGGGSSISNRTGTYTYSGTQSPGDSWLWTISTTEFSGSNETTGMWVTGEWTALSSGFGKATIINSNHAPAINGHAYFLEFPNTLLLVKPDEANSRLIVCAASATTEPGSGHWLYVNVPGSGWDDSSNAFGTVEATNTAGHWNFNLTKYLITGECAGTQSTFPTWDFVYSNGTFTNESGGVSPKLVMTPSNVFIEDDGSGGGGSAGATLESYNSSDFASIIDHTYKGFRVEYDSSLDSGETQAVTLSKMSGQNALRGFPYSDIDDGTLMPYGVKITFEASPQDSNGFVRGIVTDMSNNYPEIVQCVVSRVGPSNNRRYMIFGIGLKFSTDQPFNFLMIQAD
jgi:hypothetical protein